MLYNGNYGVHGWFSQLLVDLNGYIIAYKTMIHGRIHDCIPAIYTTVLFQCEIMKNFIGDLLNKLDLICLQNILDNSCYFVDNFT